MKELTVAAEERKRLVQEILDSRIDVDECTSDTLHALREAPYDL